MSLRGKLFALGALAFAGCLAALVSVSKSEAWDEFWYCAMECCVTSVSSQSGGRNESEAVHRQAESTSRSAWTQSARPRLEASRSQPEAARRERARYSVEMRAAPMMCREEVRSRVPQDWSLSTLSLGRSAHADGPGTWLVSGMLTATDDGARQRYRYQCRFQGTEVAEVTIGDPHSLSAAAVLPARQ